MNEKVHYEDNLFFLHTEIVCLQNGMKLSIDNNFFASRIVDHIFSIDRILNQHYELLQENRCLIRRNDYLHSIKRIKSRLAELIEQVADKEGFFSVKDREKFPELKRKMATHLEHVQTIRRTISEALAEKENSPTFSLKEYELLFTKQRTL